MRFKKGQFPIKTDLYAWFNFPDFNSVYSCHFYLAGLSQQQKL